MSRRKKEDNEGSRAIAKAILEEYQPTTVEEVQDALREIFGSMFEALLQGEMDAHLGYKSNDRGAKGAFPSEDAVLKALYLRLTELYKKWANRPVPNWAMVRNQLSMDAKIQARIMKYEKI